MKKNLIYPVYWTLVLVVIWFIRKLPLQVIAICTRKVLRSDNHKPYSQILSINILPGKFDHAAV